MSATRAIFMAKHADVDIHVLQMYTHKEGPG